MEPAQCHRSSFTLSPRCDAANGSLGVLQLLLGVVKQPCKENTCMKWESMQLYMSMHDASILPTHYTCIPFDTSAVASFNRMYLCVLYSYV